MHFAEVVRDGFLRLQTMAAERNLSYDLIGKADADVFFDSSCLASLVREFGKDESLGIASPRWVFARNAAHQPKFDLNGELDVAFSDHPTDGLRLYRRRCFEEIGGIQIVRAPETVAEASAMMHNWTLRRFDHIHAGISRMTHDSTSLWSRWEMAGSEAHYLGYSLILVLGRFCSELVFARPRYKAFAYAWGYLRSGMRREPRIDDTGILEYFRYRRLREIIPQVPGLLQKAVAQRARISREQ